MSHTFMASELLMSRSIAGAMKALKWRAVALDLDGTTLNNSHAFTSRTLSTLQQVDAEPERCKIWQAFRLVQATQEDN